MTIWHTLGTVAGAVPGVGSLLSVLQRLGIGSSGDGETDATASPAASISFTISIIALSAKLARSDGAVTVDEVAMFRRIMSVPEGEEDNVRRLFNLAKQDVAGYESYARQIGRLLANDKGLAREIMDGLFAIAAADGVLHDLEDGYLKTVSGHLAFSEAGYIHVRSLYFDAPMGPYEVLGLAPDASDIEIKARHKILVKEHHPDRLAGMGCAPAFIARAEQKLARINAAFDTIAQERGL